MEKQLVPIEKIVADGVAVFESVKDKVTGLAEQYKTLTVTDINDNKQLKKVSEARKELKRERIEIEKQGKEIRKSIKEVTDKVSAKEKELLSIIEPVETQLEEEEKRVEAERERIRLEAVRKEEERVQGRMKAITATGAVFNGISYKVGTFSMSHLELLKTTDEDFEELVEMATHAAEVEQKRLEEEEAEREEQRRLEEERLRKEQEAREEEQRKIAEEQERMRKEREELERLRREQEEREQKIRDEEERLKQERERMEREEEERKERERKEAEEREQEEQVQNLEESWARVESGEVQPIVITESNAVEVFDDCVQGAKGILMESTWNDEDLKKFHEAEESRRRLMDVNEEEAIPTELEALIDHIGDLYETVKDVLHLVDTRFVNRVQTEGAYRALAELRNIACVKSQESHLKSV